MPSSHTLKVFALWGGLIVASTSDITADAHRKTHRFLHRHSGFVHPGVLVTSTMLADLKAHSASGAGEWTVHKSLMQRPAACNTSLMCYLQCAQEIASCDQLTQFMWIAGRCDQETAILKQLHRASINVHVIAPF